MTAVTARILAAAAAAALPAALLTAQPAAASARTRTAYVTFYGWPDNTPPDSAAIAYPRKDGFPAVHNHANKHGERGTWWAPLTLATSPREIPVGTRVYIPYLRKYGVMEDQCAECVRQWNRSRRWHVDVWVGGKGIAKRRVLAREDALTRSRARIIINPRRGLPVSRRKLIP